MGDLPLLIGKSVENRSCSVGSPKIEADVNPLSADWIRILKMWNIRLIYVGSPGVHVLNAVNSPLQNYTIWNFEYLGSG